MAFEKPSAKSIGKQGRPSRDSPVPLPYDRSPRWCCQFRKVNNLLGLDHGAQHVQTFAGEGRWDVLAAQVEYQNGSDFA